VPAVAALLDHRSALGALRRSLPRDAAPVVACRSALGLSRVLEGRLVEAIVLGGRAARKIEVAAIRSRFPRVPMVVFGRIRSDDAELLLTWQRLDVAAVAIDGVDDPLVGDLVMRHSVSARRRSSLADAPRLLRLTEPLQLAAWELLVAGPGRAPRTIQIARSLGLSREHLSRQFGAGGAPNLKRVADLLTVLTALSLLGNPGYLLPAVARLLGFTTPSHLRAVIQRIAGVPVAEAMRLSERELLGRFVRGGGRSRSGADRRVGG
jgi:AraC-like DNA-binding protein